jgi:glycosyltransferase involved in cell wall biosynthesis
VLGMGWFPDQPGGLTRYLRGLTEALGGGGGPVPRAVVIGPVADRPANVVAVADPDQPLAARLARFARAAGREARYADVVDSHFALYAFACLFVPAVRRLPLVVHFHGPWADEFVANGRPADWRIATKRRVERPVYRRAAAIVVLSEAFKRILVERFGIDAGRVHVMWPGVDLDRFSPGDRSAARASLGLPDSAWVAVTARRLVPRMGVDVLLTAWASLDDPDRVLLVVGDGEDRGALEGLADRLGVRDRVRFTGRVDDATLTACYRAADVSVVPSNALEGFGLVVLEALACGTPVVASDVDGLRETLERLDPGLLVPAGDAGALAARLAAARSGERPLPAAADCRAFAEAFSWPEVADRHWDLYRRAARGSR